MFNVVKVRLYPTIEQKLALAKNFGCARFVSNYYLNKSNIQYLELKKGLKYKDMASDLTKLKVSPEHIWLKEAHSQVLQQSLKNLETAFKNFFAKRAKFPNFKAKKNRQSIRYPQGVQLCDNGIKIPKIGVVKAKIHRPIVGTIKSVTIELVPSGKYFASILFEDTRNSNYLQGTGAIGIDLGLNHLATIHNGVDTTKVDAPKYLKKYSKNLARKQKNLARKAEIAKKRKSKEYSKNREKARRKAAKVYEKISNCRKDLAHKLSRKLVDENQVIVIENLNIKALGKSMLAKSVLDAGWGMLTNFIDYKIQRQGGKLLEVDRFFPSSKLCSCCGFKVNKMPLNVREWQCPVCKTEHDRDENAAKNILFEGIKLISEGTPNKPVGETVKRLAPEVSVSLVESGSPTL